MPIKHKIKKLQKHVYGECKDTLYGCDFPIVQIAMHKKEWRVQAEIDEILCSSLL